MVHTIQFRVRALVCFTLCGAVLLWPRSLLDGNAATVSNQRISSSSANMPLVFEANRGQSDSNVKFISHGQGFTLFLTPGQAVLAMRVSPMPSEKREILHTSQSKPESTVAIGMQLVGANSDAVLRGEQRRTGKVNYLIGNDPQKWQTNIPIYGHVRYQNIYPGTDLIYRGNHRQLEYDFVVSPEAEPQRITLKIQGANKLSIDAGDLVMHTAGGIVRQRRPVAYQESDGVRREVAANYVLKGSEVGFQLGAYNREQPLIIDPTVEYSTFVGSSIQGTAGWGLAVDSSGSAYVSGMTTASNFPTTFGAVQNSYAGSGDAFVSKLNPSGSDLVYSTYLGGRGNDYADAIAVDASGNAYVTGQTNSTDFPVTSGALQSHLRGSVDAFVSKLNADGSAPVYSTYLGGSGWDFAAGIAVDANNNAYVTGGTHSRDFPVTAGSFQTTNGGGLWDVFVSKFSADGSSLIYSTYLGGNGGTQQAFGDVGWAIAVDAGGYAYVTGDGTPNFPTTFGAFQSTCRSGILNAFVSKLNPSGSALVYSTYVGGSSSWDWGDAIQVDAQGNAYVGGNANSSDFPTTPGAFRTSYAGGEDGVVFKLNPNGSALQYSTYLGGGQYEVIQGIVIDKSGNAYLTGITYSSDFPITSNALQSTYGGSGDVFVTELNPQGSGLVYSSYLA